MLSELLDLVQPEFGLRSSLPALKLQQARLKALSDPGQVSKFPGRWLQVRRRHENASDWAAIDAASNDPHMKPSVL